MRSFVAGVPERRARSSTMGRRMATGGVINKARNRRNDKKDSKHLPKFGIPNKRKTTLPSFEIIPVRSIPAERMNIASTVTVAEFENPESPSEILGNDSGSICPKIISTIRIRNAVISTGKLSVTNKKGHRQ